MYFFSIAPRGDSNDASVEVPGLSEDSTDIDMLSEGKPEDHQSPNKFQSSSLASMSGSATSFANAFSNLPSNLSMTHSRGKPLHLARRGSLLFPRMRGGVASKNNVGKKHFAGRKRGSTMIPSFRGRGRASAHGRGYRGFFNYQHVTLQVNLIIIYMKF